MSPAPGGRRTIVVHDRIEPPVVAGDYEVRAAQTIGGDARLGTVPDDVRYVRVTGPRYRLPSTEILSTFPPANSDGPFVTRLAQIALRRRTLPWERADGPQRPWLALVLLTDGEATYLPSVPVASAVTEGVRLTGVNPDGPTCSAIEVTGRVVRQVFPSRQELPFTSHVREVPLDDTELAQGDEDGWVAVVLSTRLPRPGMRYRACLISLEGQWSELPDNPPVENRFSKATVYEHVSATTIERARQPRTDEVPLAIGTSRAGGADAVARKAPAAGIDRERIAHEIPPASVGHDAADAWRTAATFTATGVTGDATVPGAAAAERAGHLGVGRGSVILDVDLRVIDPGARLLRFPVLASWEFRCEGKKDFAALVRALDVGLLGTAERPARGPTDRVPDVSDTGHVVLAATERDGDASLTWYRGPLVPRAIERRPVAAVHVADQLRRVAEDGRVELGEAAAFELGRLLALSAPSTVAALREWRRQGYVRRRGARVGGASVLEGLLTHWELALADGAAVALGRRLLETVGDSEVVDRVLPDRPLVDPLPDLDVLADPARTIATGFALPVADVRRSLDRGTRPVLADGHMAPVSAAGFDALRRDASLLQPLKTQLATSVSALTGLTRAFVIRPGGQLVPHGLEEGDAEQEAGVEAQAETAEEAETVEALFPGARPGDSVPPQVEPDPPAARSQRRREQ